MVIFSTDSALSTSLKLVFIFFELILLSLLSHEVRIKQLHRGIILNAFLVSPSFLGFVSILNSFSPADKMRVGDFGLVAQPQSVSCV